MIVRFCTELFTVFYSDNIPTYLNFFTFNIADPVSIVLRVIF
jgi:hypothetical protein